MKQQKIHKSSLVQKGQIAPIKLKHFDLLPFLKLSREIRQQAISVKARVASAVSVVTVPPVKPFIAYGYSTYW